MEERPSIKKVSKGPYNPSKRKKTRFLNRCVKKINGKFELKSVKSHLGIKHNPSITKGSEYRKAQLFSKRSYKNGERVNLYGAYNEEEKTLISGRAKAILSGVFIIFVIVIYAAINSAGDSDAQEVFKGKEYFSYLGISKTMKHEDSLYGTYDLVEVDNIALGMFTYDGEEYYRFQAMENGKKAYDSEITDSQGDLIEASEGTKPKVEVYKRNYTKDNGSNTSIFYYKLYVPKGKIKKL